MKNHTNTKGSTPPNNNLDSSPCPLIRYLQEELDEMFISIFDDAISTASVEVTTGIDTHFSAPVDLQTMFQLSAVEAAVFIRDIVSQARYRLDDLATESFLVHVYIVHYCPWAKTTASGRSAYEALNEDLQEAFAIAHKIDGDGPRALLPWDELAPEVQSALQGMWLEFFATEEMDMQRLCNLRMRQGDEDSIAETLRGAFRDIVAGLEVRTPVMLACVPAEYRAQFVATDLPPYTSDWEGD